VLLRRTLQRQQQQLMQQMLPQSLGKMAGSAPQVALLLLLLLKTVRRSVTFTLIVPVMTWKSSYSALGIIAHMLTWQLAMLTWTVLMWQTLMWQRGICVWQMLTWRQMQILLLAAPRWLQQRLLLLLKCVRLPPHQQWDQLGTLCLSQVLPQQQHQQMEPLMLTRVLWTL
jgi:hypothetical protein